VSPGRAGQGTVSRAGRPDVVPSSRTERHREQTRCRRARARRAASGVVQSSAERPTLLTEPQNPHSRNGPLGAVSPDSPQHTRPPQPRGAARAPIQPRAESGAPFQTPAVRRSVTSEPPRQRRPRRHAHGSSTRLPAGRATADKLRAQTEAANSSNAARCRCPTRRQPRHPEARPLPAEIHLAGGVRLVEIHEAAPAPSAARAEPGPGGPSGAEAAAPAPPRRTAPSSAGPGPPPAFKAR